MPLTDTCGSKYMLHDSNAAHTFRITIPKNGSQIVHCVVIYEMRITRWWEPTGDVLHLCSTQSEHDLITCITL